LTEVETLKGWRKHTSFSSINLFTNRRLAAIVAWLVLPIKRRVILAAARSKPATECQMSTTWQQYRALATSSTTWQHDRWQQRGQQQQQREIELEPEFATLKGWRKLLAHLLLIDRSLRRLAAIVAWLVLPIKRRIIVAAGRRDMIQNEHNGANTLACQRVRARMPGVSNFNALHVMASGRVTYSVPTLPIPITLTAVQIPTGTVQLAHTERARAVRKELKREGSAARPRWHAPVF
jgi:hypothetical protein